MKAKRAQQFLSRRNYIPSHSFIGAIHQAFFRKAKLSSATNNVETNILHSGLANTKKNSSRITKSTLLTFIIKLWQRLELKRSSTMEIQALILRENGINDSKTICRKTRLNGSSDKLQIYFNE